MFTLRLGRVMSWWLPAIPLESRALSPTFDRDLLSGSYKNGGHTERPPCDGEGANAHACLVPQARSSARRAHRAALRRQPQVRASGRRRSPSRSRLERRGNKSTTGGVGRGMIPNVPTLTPGQEIAGHRIDGVVGEGGMGVVYRATQLELDRPVALKLIAPSLANDPDFRARFKREARIAASID